MHIVHCRLISYSLLPLKENGMARLLTVWKHNRPAADDEPLRLARSFNLGICHSMS